MRFTNIRYGIITRSSTLDARTLNFRSTAISHMGKMGVAALKLDPITCLFTSATRQPIKCRAECAERFNIINRSRPKKRTVNPPTRNWFIRRLFVTRGVSQLYVGLGSTDHCTIQVSQNLGFAVAMITLKDSSPSDRLRSIEPWPFVSHVY